MDLLTEISKLAKKKLNPNESVFEATELSDIPGVKELLECDTDASCKCAEGACGGSYSEEEEDFDMSLPDHIVQDLADEVLVALGDRRGPRDIEPVIREILQMYADEDYIPGLNIASEEEMEAIVNQIAAKIMNN